MRFSNTGCLQTQVLIVVIAVIMALLLGYSNSCRAEGYIKKPSAKLGTGFINAVTCWLEIPLRVRDRYRESENHFYGACLAPSLGVLEGNTLTLGRLAAGVVDVATFMAPWPLANFEPIMKPIWKQAPRDVGLDTGK